MIKDKKILELETVGSQERPMTDADRKAFSDYFKKRKAQRAKKGRAAAKKSTSKVATT